MPKRPVCGAGQGDRREDGTSPICSRVSPATATHGMAQADAGAFLMGAPADLPAQSIIADAAGGAAIAIVSQSDSMDEVHLYDLAGERQHYFDGEVIPSPFEGWAKTLAEAYPHIQVDVR